jgi:hypothetical protein
VVEAAADYRIDCVFGLLAAQLNHMALCDIYRDRTRTMALTVGRRINFNIIARCGIVTTTLIVGCYDAPPESESGTNSTIGDKLSDPELLSARSIISGLDYLSDRMNGAQAIYLLHGAAAQPVEIVLVSTTLDSVRAAGYSVIDNPGNRVFATGDMLVRFDSARAIPPIYHALYGWATTWIDYPGGDEYAISLIYYCSRWGCGAQGFSEHFGAHVEHQPIVD